MAGDNTTAQGSNEKKKKYLNFQMVRNYGSSDEKKGQKESDRQRGTVELQETGDRATSA